MKCSLISLILLKKSWLFSILLFSSTSLHCSLKKAFLCLLTILWNLAFSWMYLSLSPLPFTSLLSSAIYEASSISFSRGWFWSPPPVQCYKPLSILLQAICLPDLIPWIYSSPPLNNHKAFDLVIHEWPSDFPYFLQFKPEFSNNELMIWATVLFFAYSIEHLHLWLQSI